MLRLMYGLRRAREECSGCQKSVYLRTSSFPRVFFLSVYCEEETDRNGVKGVKTESQVFILISVPESHS